MCTKGDTSRSRFSPTNIFGPSRDMWNATRCEPNSSCEPRNGGGRAPGAAVMVRPKNARFCRHGPWKCPQIGSPVSTKSIVKRSLNHFERAFSEAALMESRNGRRESRNASDCSQRTARRDARERPMAVPSHQRVEPGKSIGPPSLPISDLSRFLLCPAFCFCLSAFCWLSRFLALAAGSKWRDHVSRGALSHLPLGRYSLPSLG